MIPSTALAVQKSRPLPADSRLHVMTYSPNGIHHYKGYYNYQSSILLEEGESVQTISMGDTQSWQIVPQGNRIFIKPIAENPEHANTNMLLITNKRVYHFTLEAAEVDEDLGVNDPKLIFETKFLYPGSTDSAAVMNFNKQRGPSLDEPEKYNFNYTVSGSDIVAPLRVFDDGEFTFFQFKDVNADIPAFFMVNALGEEELINYRVAGDYIVIERVSSVFTLRHGKDVVCVFNESRPLQNLHKHHTI
jgi:type IV secretion system protein VirB9